MSLLVTELALVDFRCFERRSVTLSPTTTILVGPNAVGKTCTVEALQLLTAGTSSAAPRPGSSCATAPSPRASTRGWRGTAA